MNLSNFSTLQILDALPENIGLEKDSGLWRIDFQGEFIFNQEVDQDFDLLIRSIAEYILKRKKVETVRDVALRETLLTNLSSLLPESKEIWY